MLFDFETMPQPNIPGRSGGSGGGQSGGSGSTRRNAYEMNYERLERLLGRPLDKLKIGDHFQLVASGYMDLVVEVIDRCRSTNGAMVSLAHYYELNGDLCQDPDVVVRVLPPGRKCSTVPSSALDEKGDPEHGRIEGLSFQQAIPPIYDEVYDWSSGKPTLNRGLQASINQFLTLWLNNLEAQGHRVKRFDKG